MELLGFRHCIDTSADGAKAVHLADIDSDGDLDFVGAMYDGDSIAWYENDGGQIQHSLKQ